MRKSRLLAIALVASAAPVILVAFPGSGSASPKILTAAEISNLKPWIEAVTAKAGDATPASASAVATTRQAAVGLMTLGDKVDSDQRVALVLVKGTFNSGSLISTPRGVSLPTADELLIAFDTSTGLATDITPIVSAKAGVIDLSSLGAVADVPLS